MTVADVTHPKPANGEWLFEVLVKRFRQIALMMSQSQGQPCSLTLGRLEVVKTDGTTQALNQTAQLQPLGPLPNTQLRSRLVGRHRWGRQALFTLVPNISAKHLETLNPTPLTNYFEL